MVNPPTRYPRPVPVRLTAPASGSRHTGLRRLLRAYRERNLVRAIAEEALDASSARHLLGASIDGEVALLTFDDASWLTRARYAQPRLLARLNAEQVAVHVRKIRFLVRPRPHLGSNRPLHRACTRLSPASGRVIRDAARGIQDADLRRALERLAGRAHQ